MITKRIITKSSEILEIKDDLLNADLLTVDTETDGVGRFAQVIGVSLATSPTTGYYIPIKLYKPDRGLFSPWSREGYQVVESTLIEAFTKSKRLILHNATFDAKVINNTFNVDIIPFVLADTILLYHLAVSEEGPFGLKKLAVQHIDPEADSPQEDLRASVIANGGKWTKYDKDFYKGDWKLLGNYAIYDVLYTRQLYDKFIPLVEKDKKLKELWEQEVMPLIKVTYDMNTVGLRIDVDYFKQLKTDIEANVERIEKAIYDEIGQKIEKYELSKIKAITNITPRSEFGRFLEHNNLWPWQDKSEVHDKAILFWYKSKHSAERIFNLDSGDDKAYLLFDILKLPSSKTTASGKRSTSKDVLDELAKQYEESSVVLRLLQNRSKELKLLSTYVLPILETHIDGRIYPNFNQAGTTSGRYSSGGNSINIQTLPRDDHRIKAGFVPDDGEVFIAADFSALEPRTFAFVSGEPKLIDTMNKGLDFYSSIAINVLGLKDVSANPEDKNYLGKVNKEKRQLTKSFCLAIPYGASAGRLAQMMKIEYEEAEDLYQKYISAFPVLKQWMDRSDLEMKKNGFVESLLGRRKRNAVIHLLYNKYGMRNFSKTACFQIIDKLGDVCGITDGTSLYLECRNALNVAKNHKIQSFAASICNRAAILFQERIEQAGLNAKIILQVHDELVVKCSKQDAEKVSFLLKDSMIYNSASKLMSVKLDATPIITDKNLAEAK